MRDLTHRCWPGPAGTDAQKQPICGRPLAGPCLPRRTYSIRSRMPPSACVSA